MSGSRDMTPDRAIYQVVKTCKAKHRYATYTEAIIKNQYIYHCLQCDGFHRTMKPLDAKSQIHLIERLFGEPITPEKINMFNELRL